MNVRATLSWLLVGALAASLAVNFGLLGLGTGDARQGAPAAQGAGSHSVPSFHLSPDASGDRCPTLERLELTEAQRADIRRCTLSSLSTRTGLAIEIDAAAAQLDEVLASEAIDNQRALELADRISELRGQQYRAWIGSILVVREVLTPEQLRLLHELESR
ncbi:MAG: periplasmic heavy metal sensor [Planctomycetes bacterium]|nr:periplasmic heavy metal sensor [Planctomycetota bacterium]